MSLIAHVLPPSKPLCALIDPPSSKNFTTRYTLASCLALGRSIVHRPAVQDDAVAMVRCCRGMGAEITALDAEGRPVEFCVENAARVDRLEIDGFGAAPKLRHPREPLNPGNAGAVFRLLLAISALLPEVRWETEHKDSLGKRPNIDQIAAMQQLGVEIEYRGAEGLLPMRVRGGLDRMKAHIGARRRELGLGDDEPYPVTVSGDVSSQFTSALLFLAPLLGEHLQINVTGRLKSLPLIETTRNVLSMAGVGVESSDARHIHVIGAGQSYAARRWETNGDWPGSAAILAAGAVVPGSRIAIRRLFEDEQGEKECVPFYGRMGCRIYHEMEPGEGELLVLESPAAGTALRGASVNGDLCTDAVLAMMGAAMFAEGESRFVQIRNLQFKECDRVREPMAELRKVWVTGAPPAGRAPWYEPEDDPDTIHVEGLSGGFEGGIEVDGRGDHRVIMLLSIVALGCRKGLSIRGAEHVSKSFPGWFDTLRKMGVSVRLEADAASG